MIYLEFALKYFGKEKKQEWRNVMNLTGLGIWTFILLFVICLKIFTIKIFSKILILKKGHCCGAYLVLFSCEANYIYLCKAPWKHSTQHQRVPKAVITGSTRTVTATNTPSAKEWVKPLQVPLILLSKAPEAWVLPGIHSPTRSKRRESHAQLSPKLSHFWRTLSYCHLRKWKKQQLDKTRFSPAASTSPHMLKHVEEELHPQGLQTSSATGCDPGPWTVLVTRMLHRLVNKFNCLHNLLFNDTEQP